MKPKQIRAMSSEEISNKLVELRKEMVKYGAQIAAGTSIKSPALVRNTKKTIARLNQELKNKEK
ncbi:MAG: 50S ribosomal protein L29 [Candidatus Woesearchaeota archaeon]